MSNATAIAEFIQRKIKNLRAKAKRANYDERVSLTNAANSLSDLREELKRFGLWRVV